MGRKQAQALLAALISWPLAAQEYTPDLIPPQIIGSPQTTTPLNGGDDSTRVVQFAFPFEYYGQTFTQAWVSTNGFVSFQNVGPLCCEGVPVEQAPRNTIYGLWSDWVSGPNPYYRSTETGVLFGWYNTQEFGGVGSSTFEIGLFPDGKIQFNYGTLSNQYHTLSAGITGPTDADNIQLFYGQNVHNLQNQSGILLPSAPEPPPPPPEPEPEPVVVPPAAIDPAPDVAPNPTQEVLQNEPEPVQEDVVVEEPVAEAEIVSAVVEETVPEDVIVSDDIVEPQDENQAEDANDTPLSPDQLQALSAVEQPSAPTDEEVAQATEAVAQEAQAAEAAQVEQGAPEQTITVEVHRDRNVDFFQREAVEDADTFVRETVLQASAQNIASLMQADIQDAQTYGEQTTTEITGEGYYFGIVDGPTFLPPPATGMAERVEEISVKEVFAEETVVGTAPVQEVASAPQAEQSPVASLAVSTGVDVTPAGQAQQMEILNMAGLQGEMSAGPVVDVGDVNTGDGEAMAQIAVIPAGYSSYTQARIPDAPFYQPRDIYKNRRIPDANLALYRMMQGQDRVWNDMVEDQYE